MKYLFKIMLCIMCFASFAYAQEEVELDSSMAKIPENAIYVDYKVYSDSVVFRWAPNTSSAWLISNKYGYMIDRIIYDPLTDEEQYIPVREQPFKPLPLEEMIKRFENTDNDFAKIATEMLYGDAGVPTNMGSIGYINALSEEQNRRFVYSVLAADLNIDAAYALGLRWSFRPDANDSVVYNFRIRSLADTNKITIKEAYVSIDDLSVDEYTSLAPMEIYTEEGDSTIKIYWSKAPSFSAYNIERSTDSVNFTRLNKSPYFYSEPDDEEEEIKFIDDVLNNNDSLNKRRNHYPTPKYNIYTDKTPPGVTYYYRVQGIDAFADVSYYTSIVQGKSIVENANDYIPGNVKIFAKNDSTAIIKWDIPKDTKKLLGYSLSYSTVVDSNYALLVDSLLPINTTFYEISGLPPGYLFYYSVAAIDERGRSFTGFSVPYVLKDTIPPAKPTGVKAVIDSNGVAFISWDQNKEIDISMYNVYFGSSADGEYLKISDYPFEENYFYDQISLHTLTRSYYYKVEAIDYAGNISELSDAGEAIIPDTIPPVAPQITSYYVGNGYVKLDFVLSSSNDIKEHKFYRKISGGEWELLKVLPIKDYVNMNTVTLFDSSIVTGKDYEYSMMAEDVAGLQSNYANPIRISYTKANSDIIEKNVKLKVDYDNKSNSIVLFWTSDPLEADKEHYVLYRNENNSGWEMYKSFDYNINSYQDMNVKKGMNYKFKVYVFHNGSQIGECNEISFDM